MTFVQANKRLVGSRCKGGIWWGTNHHSWMERERKEKVKKCTGHLSRVQARLPAKTAGEESNNTCGRHRNLLNIFHAFLFTFWINQKLYRTSISLNVPTFSKMKKKEKKNKSTSSCQCPCESVLCTHLLIIYWALLYVCNCFLHVIQPVIVGHPLSHFRQWKWSTIAPFLQ